MLNFIKNMFGVYNYDYNQYNHNQDYIDEQPKTPTIEDLEDDGPISEEISLLIKSLKEEPLSWDIERRNLDGLVKLNYRKDENIRIVKRPDWFAIENGIPVNLIKNSLGVTSPSNNTEEKAMKEAVNFVVEYHKEHYDNYVRDKIKTDFSHLT